MHNALGKCGNDIKLSFFTFVTFYTKIKVQNRNRIQYTDPKRLFCLKIFKNFQGAKSKVQYQTEPVTKSIN